MPEVPAVPGHAGLNAPLAEQVAHTAHDLGAAVREVFAPDGPLARAVADFEPRAGQVEMAAAVARAFEDGGVLLAEAGTGTGKTLAYLVPADPEPPARAGLDRHEEPAGADLLQGHSRAARRARRAFHRDLHEGARELPVPPSPGSAANERGGPPLAGHDVLPPDHPRVVRAHRDRRSRRARGPARGSRRSGTTCRRPPRRASAPSARATTTAS